MIERERDMPRILLQFHVTGRCNLRCRHCYREEGNIEPLSTGDVLEVLRQYEELKDAFNASRGSTRRGHINLTGGEPFMREDMPEILRYMATRRHSYTYGVLSNGTMLSKDYIALLKETGVTHVQLSIDGRREVHDELRAPGDYDRTMRKAAELERAGVTVHISFTANRANYPDLPGVAAACRRRGLTRLWSDRIVPIGGGADMAALAIGPDELPGYLDSLNRAKGGWLMQRLSKTEVRMNRALQCLGGGVPYRCGAGNSLVVVDEMGRIMPCRRMPILCGDVRETTLREVYFGHPVFRELRDCGIPVACGECAHRHICRGGAKCQSYAAYGDFHRADPGCPLAKRTK